MVASKRGRGARNQATKAKPAAEEPTLAAVAPEAEVAADATEATAEDNNGTEQMDQGDEGVAPELAEESAEGEGVAPAEGESAEAQSAEAAEAEKKVEEEKVESGKILIENLPVSYLFDYQEKLKEMFSEHGEIVGIK